VIEEDALMRLQGLHHVTMFTSDARENVSFAAEALGLRFVKKTIHFDHGDFYHLYFADEDATPGAVLTWFEMPDLPPGRAGAGLIHTIELGVASPAALDFWYERLRALGRAARRSEHALRFEDHDGLAFALVVADSGNPPLRAEHPEIPARHAITGIEGARAYAEDPAATNPLLTEVLGFTDLGGGEYRLDGELRRFGWAYDPAPDTPGVPLGRGSVAHIAWAVKEEDHLAWRRRLLDAGLDVTEVKDRDYFRSIYLHEQHGVRFELATLTPGFTIDEDPERLGEQLRIPAMYADRRETLERTLTPLVNPRTARTSA
jgi:glyoxalase family protein